MNRFRKNRLDTIVMFILALLGIIGFAASEGKATSVMGKEMDSAVPVTAITPDEYNTWNVSNVSELLRTLPGVYTRSKAGLDETSSTNLNIRGIGSFTSDPASTLILVDGRRAPGIPRNLPSIDLQRIEILTSGASAVYGSDAIAGVVNIITKTPEEEIAVNYTDTDFSTSRNNPFQAGYRGMVNAENNPLGAGLSAYYDAGGQRGADAGAFYAEAAKIRYNIGGPLCDLGARYENPSRSDYELPGGLYYPSRDVAECFTDEILRAQLNYDISTGTETSNQEMHDYVYTGLYNLGYPPKSASIAAQAAYDFPVKHLALSSDISLDNDKNFFDPFFEKRLSEYLSEIDDDWYDPDYIFRPSLSNIQLADEDFWYEDLYDFNFNPVVFDHFVNYSSGGDHVMPARDNNPSTTEVAFGEQNLERAPQETFQPNDPLYKKPDTAARKAGGLLKKGFGALLSVTGVGVGTTDDDAESDDQWGLHEVGFTPMGTGQSAWDVVDGRGKNVIVAVIDSGLDINHPDAPLYIWKNEGEIPGNNIDDDTNGYVDDINGWNFVAESNDIDDDYGHGTHVAGIIAANTDNGIGIAGVNPGAQIMTLKVSKDSGMARSLAIYRALRYAVDNGARVINISLGLKGLSRLEQIGINYAYAMGCVVVVAAGNQGGNIAEYGPPGARRTFSVASLNIDGSRRSSSNKGLMVAVAAPGESIYSLTAQNGKRDGQIIPILAGEYHRLNGTSFAAPIVAGTASLILANYPYLTNRQVEDIILSSAADAEDPGWDAKTGMGRLDARNALSMPPDAAFAPRITEWIINRDSRGKVASVDVYGVIRGPVANYEISVGQGKKPSSWTPAFGPSNRAVDHGHIARLPGSYFKKGSSWSLQLTATSQDGLNRTQKVVVRNDS